VNQRLIYDDSNRQLLEGVFNNTHILIAYLDPEFTFLMVNEAYARVDEKTPDFFPGKNHFDLYPNDENQALFQKVVDTGEALYVYAKPFEYAANPERGVSHWDWSLTPVKGEAGQVIGLILSLLDVTVPIEAAEALQRSQRDLHSLMTNYPGMACRCRKDSYWQMEFVSPGSLALTGYTPEEFQQGAVNYGQIIHPDDKPLVDEAVFKAIEKTGSFSTAYRIRHKNCDTRWVQEHGYVVDDGTGQSDYLEVFITDITESRYAEEALKRSEERFRKTFDNVAVGIAHISVRSGAIYRANPMFCRILGYSNDEIMDFTHEEITFPDDLGLDQKNLAELLQGEHKFVHFEKRYIARNQELIWVNATIALETDINDHPNYFIYVIEDISEKKLANERMNLLSRALEQTADIVMVTDSRGIIEYVNPAFEEVTGYFRAEVLGK